MQKWENISHIFYIFWPFWAHIYIHVLGLWCTYISALWMSITHAHSELYLEFCP